MPRIPTAVHGVIDYAVGAGLIAMPELIGLTDDSAATNFTRSMGAAAISYSVCTDYELGAVKLIPMPTHLRIDTAWAATLALGPWIFGFGRRGLRYWLPHAVVAVVAAAIVSVSEPQPRS